MFQQLIHSFPLPPVPPRQAFAPGKSFAKPGRTTFKTPPTSRYIDNSLK